MSAKASPETRDTIQMSSPTPVIVAHRGLHHVHPENSIAAFQEAWTSGITWCECDVQVTADHRTIVIHDGTLDRTTTGAGSVRHKVWENLRKCHLRDHAGRATNQTLSLLNDVLAVMPSNCGMLIELKTPMPLFHHMARAYLQRGWRCMFQSFDVDTVRALCANGLGAHTALLLQDLNGLNAVGSIGCHGVHVRHDLLDRSVISQIRTVARWVGCWTPNAERDVLRARELGVDLIITDQPHC